MEETPDAPERVLSIRQPWASLILAGHKDVENRTWETLWRGRMLVHAGKLHDPFGYRNAAAIVGERVNELVYQRGAYLGAVTVVDVHKEENACCLPWGEAGVYHWVLTDPVKLPEPIPGPGRLALYRTPADILAVLEQQA